MSRRVASSATHTTITATETRKIKLGTNDLLQTNGIKEKKQNAYYCSQRGLSLSERLQLFCLTKTKYVIRGILFVVVLVCSASIGFNVYTSVLGSSPLSSSFFVLSPRILFETNVPLSKAPVFKELQRYQNGLIKDFRLMSQKPRVIGCYFDDTYFTVKKSDGSIRNGSSDRSESSQLIGVESIDPNVRHIISDASRRVIEVDNKKIAAQERLTNSKEYDKHLEDPVYEGDCVPQYDWQMTSFPNCNSLHESDLTYLHAESKKDEMVRLLANGYWRDAWKVRNDYIHYDHPNVVKTLRYEHDYTPRNFDRHRRDAVAMERLTSSSNVMNIYGYCANSGIFEFANGGSLYDALWGNEEQELSTSEKLIAAYHIAASIADVHNSDKEGVASIVHTDITPSQFVFVNQEGRYKINDFNRARFVRWDTKKNTTCGFHIGNNPGRFRAPEEYAYKEETEKIDVYSMGNIFYSMMSLVYPYENDLSSEEAIEKIMHGERPHLSSRFRHSDDPFTLALVKAMEKCWVQDPTQRASAREVQVFLANEISRIKKAKDQEHEAREKKRRDLEQLQ